MRLHRFYIEGGVVEAGEGTLRDAGVVDQIRSVFRLRVGDFVILFDGSGLDYVCEIVSMGKDTLSYRVTETRQCVTPASVKLSLAMSLVKKDKFEWIVEKGTELGVTEFIPVVSERSEKKGFNRERMKKICIEAVEQSGRGDVPTIREPQDLEDYLAGESRAMIAFHTESAVRFSKESTPASNELVALVGPEGGWTEKEIALFRNKGASIVKLETPVLRAETAAIVAAALMVVK
ncbi:MAG TPA: RsmE family RNA methyltransferase [Candidatus Paceibacterota bacterium]|jgi:RNA methyltransferase, RsmE family